MSDGQKEPIGERPGTKPEPPPAPPRGGEPAPVADVLAQFAERMEAQRATWNKCRTCGEPAVEVDLTIGVLECRECSRKAFEARKRQDLVGKVPGLVTRWLVRAGMSPRETTATLEAIPGPVRSVLVDYDFAVLTRGSIPRFGFGLSGPAGIGKSFALAAGFRECALHRLTREVEERGRDGLRLFLRWVSLPRLVNELRVMSVEDDGLDRARRVMEELENADALVLDDVGSERVRGVHGEDWVASLLDLLIDTRFHHERPTWFTTHLSAEELVERYDARFYSRLCGDNPLAVVRSGPDLRMVKR